MGTYTTSSTGTVRAREYLRVSLDRSGRQRSVDEQHVDNERAAAEHGFTLGEPYREQAAVSASRYASKSRDDFARLLGDLESGAFGAEVLLLWESSRGSRRVGEWVALVELCDAHGVRIHVTTHGRTYDPSNARDRRSLLEDAVDSEYESSKSSARIRRALEASAVAGRPHGRAPFGLRAVHDARTGRLLDWEADTTPATVDRSGPGRAEIVRELFGRLRAGHSFGSITSDFRGRGIVHRSGRPFTHGHLRKMATMWAYAGRRSHRGEVTVGSWPALVPESEFLAVQRIVTAPARRSSRNGRAVHVLSRIIVCDVCSGPMSVSYRSGRGVDVARYVCRDAGHVKVGKAVVDEVVIGAILAYLASEKVYADVSAGDDTDARVEEIRAELGKARAELDDLHDLAGSGAASVRMVARAEPQMLDRIAGLERAERELVTPSALAGFIDAGVDVAVRWESVPVSARREVARILLTPDHLGQVRIARATRPGPGGTVADRIVWDREGR